MSFKLPENKEEAFELANLAIDGLNAIANAVGGAQAGTAGGVLTVVRVILATIEEGFSGKVTPERVREELHKLRVSLASNDLAADAALAAKFKDSKDDAKG